MEFALPFPKSREEIARIQHARKRNAFELAKKATWYRGKLDHVDPDKLDDKDVWESIPILDKDVLRKFSHGDFLDNLCIVPNGEIAEYWRSGGSTGQPVFYPRNKDDVRYAELSWGRSFPCIGIGPGDLCHISFPFRRPSRRPDLGAQLAPVRRRYGVGWRRKFVSVDRAARPDWGSAANGLHRHEQLCAPFG